MKYLTILILIGLFIGLSNTDCEAQFFNHLKNTVKHAVEHKVEQKVDQEVQKAADQMVENAWDQFFGEAVTNGKPAKNSPFIFKSNVKTEDVYHFDIVTTMKIVSEQKGQSPSTMLMKLNFNDRQPYTGAKFINQDQKENGNTFLIYDFKNKVMLMLMSSDKNKFSFAYDWKEALADSQNTASQPPQPVNWDSVRVWNGYSKIGNKTIAGYDCSGYQYQSDSLRSQMWITRDVSLGIQNMFSAYGTTKQLKGQIPDGYPSGMVMEMKSENLNNGDKTTMTVTDINKNADVNYKMSEYPPMQFGSKPSK